MDILICRLHYPNDPTGNLGVHQNFVGVISNDHIVFYSISSLLGKESRVLDEQGEEHEEYYVLKKGEQNDCSLRVPSFIDCTKSYKVNIDNSIDLTLLANRSIPSQINTNIHFKINDMISKGNHTEYTIALEDFKNWNKKCVVN